MIKFGRFGAQLKTLVMSPNFHAHAQCPLVIANGRLRQTGWDSVMLKVLDIDLWIPIGRAFRKPTKRSQTTDLSFARLAFA